MVMGERLDKALADFRAGHETGVSDTNSVWFTLLRRELADAETAVKTAEPDGEEAESPLYLEGWRDAIDYLVHLESRFDAKP